MDDSCSCARAIVDSCSCARVRGTMRRLQHQSARINAGMTSEGRHTRLRNVSRTAARSHLHGSRTRQTPQRAAQARFKFGRALPKSCPRIERKSQPIFVLRCCFISVSAWWHVVEENNPCAKPPKPDNQPGTSTTWLGLGAWDRGLGKQHGLGVHQCITVCEFEGEVVSACDPGGSVTWIAHDVFYRRLGAGPPRSSI